MGDKKIFSLGQALNLGMLLCLVGASITPNSVAAGLMMLAFFLITTLWAITTLAVYHFSKIIYLADKALREELGDPQDRKRLERELFKLKAKHNPIELHRGYYIRNNLWTLAFVAAPLAIIMLEIAPNPLIPFGMMMTFTFCEAMERAAITLGFKSGFFRYRALDSATQQTPHQ